MVLVVLFGVAAAVNRDAYPVIRSLVGMLTLFAFYGASYFLRPGELGGGDFRLGGLLERFLRVDQLDRRADGNTARLARGVDRGDHAPSHSAHRGRSRDATRPVPCDRNPRDGSCRFIGVRAANRFTAGGNQYPVGGRPLFSGRFSPVLMVLLVLVN